MQPPADPTTATNSVILRAEGPQQLAVEGERLLTDRRAQLYLGTLNGGRRTDTGWLLPTRNKPFDDLVVQVVRWLEQNHYKATLDGLVNEAVRRDGDRRRSFARTQQAARELRAGRSHIDETGVHAALDQIGWNRADRDLRPHQLTAVVHGLTAANPANFSVPGAGKTASTLALAAVHLAHGDIDAVLVVGPLSCFRPWEAEVALALPRLETRRLRGAAPARRSRIRGIQPGEVALTSYASAAADQLALIELCRRLNVMLVADESHRIKRFTGGLWAPAVTAIAKYARVRVVLSGTPMPQSGRDLYTQLNILWPGRELTSSQQRFRSRVDNDFPSLLSEILPFVFRTPKSDLGLPDYTVHRTPVPLSTEQADIYRLVEQHLRTALQAAGPSEADRLAALRRGRPLRLLQAATNPALLRGGAAPSRASVSSPTLLTRLDGYDPKVDQPAKLQAAVDIVQTLPLEQKAVIWSTFIGQLDLAADAFRTAGVAVYQVDGRVPAEELDLPAQPPSPDVNDDETAAPTREQTIADFLDHPGKAVLITNPASCSESISLHRACHTAIYLDRTYDCAQWLQSIDRIHRLGLPPDAHVTVHVLQAVTPDGQPTADGLVDTALLRKETQMRQLLEGATLASFQRSDDPLDAATGDDDDLRDLMSYLLGREQ
jgi:hypothetical protein